MARRSPTARGRVCVPPPPGMMPSVTSVSARRGLRGVEKIAAACDLAAAAIGRAVDGADDRDRAVDQRPHHALENDVLARPRLVGHAAALLQVAAGAERLVAGAGQDDAAQALRIERYVLEIAHEVASHLGVERVGCVRPVERTILHVIVDRFERERFECRRSRSCASQEKPLPTRRIFRLKGRKNARCSTAYRCRSSAP